MIDKLIQYTNDNIYLDQFFLLFQLFVLHLLDWLELQLKYPYQVLNWKFLLCKIQDRQHNKYHQLLDLLMQYLLQLHIFFFLLGLDQKFYFEVHLVRLNKQAKLLVKAFMDLIFSFFNLELDMLYQFITDQLKKVKYLLGFVNVNLKNTH